MHLCTLPPCPRPRGAAPARWLSLAPLLLGLAVGCVEADKIGGQDGEEGTGDGGLDEAGDAGAGDEGAGDGDGAGGTDTGVADPPDRSGRGTRSYVEGDSAVPGEHSCGISWSGVLVPGTSGCVDCTYDFSVEWTVDGVEGTCTRAPSDETRVYAFDPNYRGQGPTVLVVGDDGELGPLAPAFETAGSVQWGVGPLDEPYDATGGLRYRTARDEASIAFTD